MDRFLSATSVLFITIMLSSCAFFSSRVATDNTIPADDIPSAAQTLGAASIPQRIPGRAQRFSLIISTPDNADAIDFGRYATATLGVPAGQLFTVAADDIALGSKALRLFYDAVQREGSQAEVLVYANIANIPIDELNNSLSAPLFVAYFLDCAIPGSFADNHLPPNALLFAAGRQPSAVVPGLFTREVLRVFASRSDLCFGELSQALKSAAPASASGLSESFEPLVAAGEALTKVWENLVVY